MKKAIVTGAGGFIGRALVSELCSRGIKVYAIVRNPQSEAESLRREKNCIIVHCDMEHIERLTQLISDRDINVFYHLAWSGVSGPDRENLNAQMNNINYSCRAAKVCESLSCDSFVFASSIWEQECVKVMEQQENVKLSSFYSSAKIAAHYMSRTLFNHSGKVAFKAGMITNVYGPGEYTPRLINTTIRKLLKHEDTSFTSATQTYDFVYIEDVARAFYNIGFHGLNNKTYYIGSPNPASLKSYLIRIRDCIDPTAELGIGRKNEEGIHLDYSRFDLNALTKDTGYIPEIGFEEGILRTGNWLAEVDRLTQL